MPKNKYLDTIEKYYGNKTTERKSIPLINHIHEGLQILDSIHASQIAKNAYCIHPILQGDSKVCTNLELVSHLDIPEIILTMEYRKSANSYLPKPDANGYVSTHEDIYVICPEVKDMLIADKLQNYHSLMQHRPVTPQRHEELVIYFNDWFEYLGIKDAQT